MRVRDYLIQFNTKKSISNTRLHQLKMYNLSMYRAYMIKLYDKGYISDPTKWDSTIIYANIAEMGITDLFLLDGGICLDCDRILFALSRTIDEDVREFLSILHEVVRYREMSQEIDKLYDELDFSYGDSLKRTFYKDASLELKATASFISSQLPIKVGRGVLQCFVDEGDTVMGIDYNEELWDIAMRELGVPEEDYKKNGLFDTRLTHEQEVHFMEIILEGTAMLDGKYATDLEAWLFEHKWKEQGMSVDQLGLYNYIFSHYSEKIFEIQLNLLKGLENEGERLLAILGNKVYVVKQVKNYNIPFGCFVFITDNEDNIMEDKVCVEGYSGELFNKDYLDEEGFVYVGCPIELSTDGVEANKELYYDLEQVEIGLIRESMFSVYNLSLDFESKPRFRRKPISGYDTLMITMDDLYRQALKGNIIGIMSSPIISLTGLEKIRLRYMRLLE